MGWIVINIAPSNIFLKLPLLERYQQSSQVVLGRIVINIFRSNIFQKMLWSTRYHKNSRGALGKNGLTHSYLYCPKPSDYFGDFSIKKINFYEIFEGEMLIRN